MRTSSHFAELTDAIARSGFLVRGGFHAQPEDDVPAGVASLVLVGNVGQLGFAKFRNSPEWGTVPDPLDRYTERVMRPLARRFGARVVFPQQGPPWWPFQSWAMRAEAVTASPLQILIHPRHGLWHAYRAALLFDVRITGLPTIDAADEGAPDSADCTKEQVPCTHCRTRPCLSACPVDAFDGHGFQRERCEQHLRSPAGRSCMEEGCAARNACPVAPGKKYGVGQRKFHMRAFLGEHSE